MKRIFVISDTHFGHANVLKFTGNDGKLIRPEFKNIEHMDQTIINNWNTIIQPDDIVYHLGDFCFGGKKNIDKYAIQLNGQKRLILGNHDYEAKLYYPYFEKVMSWRQFGREFNRPVVLTHFPLHDSSFRYRAGGNAVNIHGHIHEKNNPTENHINVSVERINYTPVEISKLV